MLRTVQCHSHKVLTSAALLIFDRFQWVHIMLKLYDDVVWMAGDTLKDSHGRA